MSRQPLKIAFFAALMLFFGISLTPSVAAFDDLSPEAASKSTTDSTPLDHEEEIEEGSFPEDNLLQEAFVLTTLRDIEWTMVQMVGVLDRSPAGQYPSDCDEFYLYFDLSIILLLEVLFSEPPFEFEDIYDLSFDAVLDGLIAAEPVAFLCSNGGNGHLSGHNKDAARIGLENSLERLRRVIAGGEARTGIQSESQIADLVFGEPTAEELEELIEIFGGPFDVDVFYEDLKISQELMRSMIGWLDKLADGQTVFCNEYVLYYELLNLPTVFAVVPPEYLELYQGHFNAVLNVLDTSRPLVVFCDDGGNLSEFNFGLARFGLDKSYNRLYSVIQEVERRLGVTPE